MPPPSLWMDLATRMPIPDEPGSEGFADVARFGPGDPPEHVEAGLSCMLCLGVPDTVRIDWLGQILVAVSYCSPCTASTVIELDGGQARQVTNLEQWIH